MKTFKSVAKYLETLDSTVQEGLFVASLVTYALFCYITISLIAIHI